MRAVPVTVESGWYRGQNALFRPGYGKKSYPGFLFTTRKGKSGLGKKDKEREQNLFSRFPDCEEYAKKIRPLLSGYRYRHSINVAVEAVALAEKYGADPHKAALAGILHDCMKDTLPAEQLSMMEQAGIHLSQVEQGAKKLYHALSGVAYIQQVLQIHDCELLDAVRYHTVGRAGMSPLERVVFVADFISADRDYPGVERMREKAQKDLRLAMIEGLAFTIQDLAKQEVPIHPNTVSAYNWVLMNPEMFDINDQNK